MSLRDNAPLLNSYLSYFESAHLLPFTIPGHKQRTSRIDKDLGAVVDHDTPLYGGLDEIKLTHGYLTQAEKLAAELWGGKDSVTPTKARFSSGGSTHCNQAIALAIATPGKKIAISRTSHRSLLSAIVLTGMEPIWMSPEIDSRSGIPMGIPLSEIERAISAGATAVFLTEPGYLGTISDLQPIIDYSHSHDVPVIVDAAWGGHFGFHPELPHHVIAQGADALVTSVHKALPGYSASALLIVKSKYIDYARVDQAFETTHTTSPAGAPLASIDGVRALLETRGEELLGNLLKNVQRFRHEITSVAGRKIFLEPSDFPAGRFDPVKIILCANLLGADGVKIERELILQGVRVEMADRDTVVFLATLVDDEKTISRLISLVAPIIEANKAEPRASATSISWSITPQTIISMREAYFANTEYLPAEQAINRISADLIAPYPPGVAVVAPGELLTQEIVEGLTSAQHSGVRIAYASDPSLTTFRVIKN